jgi:hypothetical protein
MIKRSWGMLAFALCVVAAVCLVGTGNRTATAKAWAVPVSTNCTGAMLSLNYRNTDAATGGARAAYYAFKNVGTAPCRLSGFPGLQLLNSHGHAVHADLIHHIDDPAGSPADLAPGAEAYFVIRYNEGGAGHVGPPCPSVARIKIRAPGTNRWFLRHEGVSLCSDVGISATTDIKTIGP